MSSQLLLVSTSSGVHDTGAQQRIVLYANELYRIPVCYQKLRVVSGTAFITQAARDLILGPGHEANLNDKADCALVSPLHTEQLILELYQE